MRFKILIYEYQIFFLIFHKILTNSVAAISKFSTYEIIFQRFSSKKNFL